MSSNIAMSLPSNQLGVRLYLLLLLHLILLCSSFQPGHFSNSRRCSLGTTSRTALFVRNVGVHLKMDSDRESALSTADIENDEEDALEFNDEIGRRNETEDTSGLPKCYVIISNLQSGSNIGSICRNALAFNVHEVIVVGRKGFRDKMRNADRGAKRRQTFVHFNSVAEAAVYLKEERNCSIVGVEIMDSAVSLTSHPFTNATAFMFGNEGGGLSERQRNVCDTFTYIPQYASGGMASINVACASAVVLQTFAVWAKFGETQRIGEKFV